MVKSKALESKPLVKSQEYIEDSASESGSESHPESTVESARSPASSNVQSSSDQGSESDSSSTNASSTSSGSSKSTGSKRKQKSSQAIEPAKKRSRIESHRPTHQQKIIPKPPSGYKSVNIDASEFTAETQRMFSGLTTKQVWHIMAPASVPITSIESLDIQATLRGDPILQHKGISYKMFAAASKGETLLLPDNVGDGYSKAKVDVSRNFHLREMPDNGSTMGVSGPPGVNVAMDKSSDALDSQHCLFFAQREGEKKLPRIQPTGLLMRYQPYGSTAEASKPYKMSHPNATDEEEDMSILNNGLVVPTGIDVTPTQTPKKNKKSKKLEHDEASRENGVSKKDVIHPNRGHSDAVNLTPRSKSQKGEQKPESERKKKKKERKDKS